jgi:hypothetical protein
MLSRFDVFPLTIQRRNQTKTRSVENKEKPCVVDAISHFCLFLFKRKDENGDDGRFFLLIWKRYFFGVCRILIVFSF